MSRKFTEEKLEKAITELLGRQGYPHIEGQQLEREPSEVLIKQDLHKFLKARYSTEQITAGEINSLIRQLEQYSAADLYDSNRSILKMVSDGFLLKREDQNRKDLYVQLVDYTDLTLRVDQADEGQAKTEAKEKVNSASINICRVVNQLEITGNEKRVPDAILYVNGLPLVVFEFKSAIREEQATIHDAYLQLTNRYRRDIPELFKYNALCVISDGVNSKVGSFFADYNFFYAWRKVTGDELEARAGVDSLRTMIEGLFDPYRLKEVLRHFIFFPDVSSSEVKIVCRYPQYYAAIKLYQNIKLHRRPKGDGKGGTYFGATGCGKSYTMLFLTRLLMRSIELESPTIILITDRADLDEQLSRQFTNAKGYIGDDTVVSVSSRADLRRRLKERKSGGVFLTTIHKFNEDTQLLTERDNVICISDEAHRSQINLDQKIRMTKDGVVRTYGFAKYLHESLPNATYVGFTGTPVDATFDVFGEVVDAYTMTESVKDEITVRIVYEGRAAKVLLDSGKLSEIERYYKKCADEGASEYQVEQSKRASASMKHILGDPDRIRALAEDFVNHYEERVNEESTVKGKAMFVCSSRSIAWSFYKEVIALRPKWAELEPFGGGLDLVEQQGLKPIERVKMVMTRSKDDEEELYNLLGTKEFRSDLDRQFKSEKSNFKIAIIVDMWLTGFDVPFLDTIYIDKPVQRHNLIQTISRVNRRYERKEKGLVVDYIGIKKQMNLALAHYSKVDGQNFEEIEASVVAVRDHLDLLNRIFYKFDSTGYFEGQPLDQLYCLQLAAEFVQPTKARERRFMTLVKRLKAAYDICSGSGVFGPPERDLIHFYIAVRSIVYKFTKPDAPDTFGMNTRVRKMIAEAIESEGVEEIFRIDDQAGDVDLFDEVYLEKIEKIKLPNTKFKLLQQLLAKAIDAFKKVNKAKGIDFSKKLKAVVDKYNERDEQNVLVSNVLEDFTEEIIELFHSLKREKNSFGELGIDFEEKAFYDILKALAVKYDFEYPEDKLLVLSKEVKIVVDDNASYTDWNQRSDIRAALKANLVMLLGKHGYPPVDRDEVYKEIFEQAENFKRNISAS